MLTDGQRESLLQFSVTARNVSLGVSACYFALATEASFAYEVVRGMCEAGMLGCAAHGVYRFLEASRDDSH